MDNHPTRRSLFVLRLIVGLALTARFLSLPLRAAENPPKPGTIVTVAGTGTPGYGGDNGPATQALLNQPGGVALDAADNLFIPEWVNDRVRKVSPDGIITTVAGTGQLGFSGDGGKATDAQLNFPAGMVVDGAGNLFMSEFYNHRVRKVSPDGIITTYAGSGPVDAVKIPGDPAKNGGFAGDNGPAMAARLNGPIGLAVDARGNLYIADFYNRRVRKVDAVTGIITTVAGNGNTRYSGDGGPATAAGMAPVGVAVDAGGDLFFSDNPWDINLSTYRVRKVDAATGIVTTVAGTGKPGFSGDGGRATDARLDFPTGLAVDSAGNLFVADRKNYRVRKVSAEGMISTVAGNGKTRHGGDGGLATETGLASPKKLAIDALGNLLISDADGARVLKVFGVAAPGLIAGMPFPMSKQP